MANHDPSDSASDDAKAMEAVAMAAHGSNMATGVVTTQPIDQAGLRTFDEERPPHAAHRSTLEVSQHESQHVIESELRRVASDLSKANRLKDEFLATLAHELRNPLAPIRSGLDLMKLAAGDPEAMEAARLIIERQVQQLTRLVDDLLDVSRIARSRLELRNCRLDLAEVIDAAVEACRPLIDLAHHQLTIEVPAEPIYLNADPHRLTQVFSNMLNNAAKYTPAGGRIAVETRCETESVVITVRDNGIGIPREMRDHIFEMFGQVESHPERGGTGLGIGLTLVKTLVELQGGDISVESGGSGQGSEFRVRLPMLQPGALEEPLPISTDIADASAQPLRVLVVDDNREAVLMLSALIRRLGHEVQTAEDGLQAVEVAATFRPQVVLMDLGMPKMSGYDAAQHLRSRAWGANMLLVALTGWDQETHRERTRVAGFDAYLVKPASRQAIEKLLASVPAQRG